jgi:toxin YoeB
MSSRQRLLSWTDEAWGDYLYWQTQDKKTLKRINKLINDVKRSPFEGIGKPEPLKENLSGFLSRRIDDKNRLVYAVDEQAITIISCRYHY